MGSLYEGGKGIDVSLGGLVWVRRRNGRWWPGRILGPEEVPDSLPSPKSGTAVKLLGREDASVDWYNIEKSTRIKAFRCGEYDECIEKAVVTAANSSKKLVKYASKEDAILHALQIERACLGKHHPGSKLTNQGLKAKDLPRLFHHNVEETNYLDKGSSNSENKSDLTQGLSLSSVSFEDPSYVGAYKEQTLERSSNDSEDYRSEGVNQMKGVDIPGTPVISSSKRKRFQVAHVHEFLKGKHNRPTVTKKPESKTLVTVPVVYEKLAHPTRSLPQGASTSKVSGLDSDLPKIEFSLRDSDGSSDDRLYDIPIVSEEQHFEDIHSLVYITSERDRVSGGTKSSESSQVETVSLGESGSTSSCTAEGNYIIQGVDDAIFKWQRKRKRSRHTNKSRRHDSAKFTDLYDEFDAYVAGANCSVDHHTFSGAHSSDTDHSRHLLKSRLNADFKIDEDRGWSRNTSHKDFREASAELLAAHGESCFSMNSNRQDFMFKCQTAEYFLFDVNLEVNANYCPQHVPYVSFTSKLTGQSVIGHPLTVEVLEDEFCQYLSDIGWSSNSCQSDDELGVKLDLESISNSVGRVARKNALQNVTPPKSRKSGLLSRKMRKLSSLTGAREQRKERKFIVEKARGPSLACVPLTIVFSRLNEALNCQNRPTHRS